jgi:hypothetical protein
MERPREPCQLEAHRPWSIGGASDAIGQDLGMGRRENLTWSRSSIMPRLYAARSRPTAAQAKILILIDSVAFYAPAVRCKSRIPAPVNASPLEQSAPDLRWRLSCPRSPLRGSRRKPESGLDGGQDARDVVHLPISIVAEVTGINREAAQTQAGRSAGEPCGTAGVVTAEPGTPRTCFGPPHVRPTEVSLRRIVRR